MLPAIEARDYFSGECVLFSDSSHILRTRSTCVSQYSAGLSRISPIVGLKDRYTYLQEGQIIYVANGKAEIHQFKRSFPCALSERRFCSRASLNNQRSEAAAVLPGLCSESDAVRAMD